MPKPLPYIRSMSWTPENIKLLRLFIGETQPDFAKRCGATRAATVAEWESGKRNPGGPTCKLLDYIAADAGFTEIRIQELKDAGGGG